MTEIFIPTDDGRWVSDSYERLARIIQEYDDYLELRWIPPEHRQTEDKKPYVIWDTRVNKPVFFASELETPEDILARLIQSDSKWGNVLDRVTARNLALDKIQDKIWQDRLAEASDQARFLVGSPKNYIKFKGKKLDDQRRPID